MHYFEFETVLKFYSLEARFIKKLSFFFLDPLLWILVVKAFEFHICCCLDFLQIIKIIFLYCLYFSLVDIGSVLCIQNFNLFLKYTLQDLTAHRPLITNCS